MAISSTTSLIGIQNENEFFSHHYLTELLVKDIGKHQTTTSRDKDSQGLIGSLAGVHQKILTDFSLGRDSAIKIDNQYEWFERLAAVFGYNIKKLNFDIGGDVEIPVHFLLNRGSPERPYLVILGAYNQNFEIEDPLDLIPIVDQFAGKVPPAQELLQQTWAEIIETHIFGQDHPPRWVIVLSVGQIVLIERSKWVNNRLLRFDLKEIFGRNEKLTMTAAKALLHRESIAPYEGDILLDELDENSHKHAVSVSGDLKYALRYSIEAIGNEAIHYLLNVKKVAVYRNPDFSAENLGLECLRYMYRLLFLFFVEAREEIGFVPVQSEAFRKGYSLDHLRNLQQVQLTTERSRDGYYFDESLRMLFKLVREGFGPENTTHKAFNMRSVDSRLFDPDSTKMLDGVKLRNSVLKDVIRKMSLSNASSKGQRGWISYSHLDINQLGAVYEALLSYRGFFAKEKLYEVKKAETEPDEFQVGYFVNASELDNYSESERVYVRNDDGDKKLRSYEKGTFIFRPAGRDREKSASYYTPKVLTKTVVKHALQELIKDDMPADDILRLTICEPAMGSAAFLNEAVSQISEKYLERKQSELGKRILSAEYGEELQRVKHYITDRNVFGVDLNPIALELAEISLWINCISKEGHVPWFGYQLKCGNSLIGAKRHYFHSSSLNEKGSAWYKLPPKRVEQKSVENEKQTYRTVRQNFAGIDRPAESVYQFLLPDPDMCKYGNKVAQSLKSKKFQKINAWRKNFVKPFSEAHIKLLKRLSNVVDELWKDHTQQLALERESTTDILPIWGQDSHRHSKLTLNSEKDKFKAGGFSSDTNSPISAYKKLKLVMDYWSALWIWPIEKAEQLPTREQYLAEVNAVLTGGAYQSELEHGERRLLAEEYARQVEKESRQIKSELGLENLEKLCGTYSRLKLVGQLAHKHRFLHWELEFADVFFQRNFEGRSQGFDLILGNPPWIRVKWNEKGVIGDYNPSVLLRQKSATELVKMRIDEFQLHDGLKRAWFDEMQQTEASQKFLMAKQNYPLLIGQQTNLYKCFMHRMFELGPDSVIGLLHPSSVYNDPHGSAFREAIYLRLSKSFRFLNEKRIFPEIHSMNEFGINIYGAVKSTPGFQYISNLVNVNTIDGCFDHAGSEELPEMKNSNNERTTTGHKERVIEVSSETLELFGKLFDEPGTLGKYSRLPALYASKQLEYLKLFSNQTRCLADFGDDVFFTMHWHETGAQGDGTIRKETKFPESSEELILSGPHFYVGTPFNKSPKRICRSNTQYDALDLTDLSKDYLPRTNYLPAIEKDEYTYRTPKVKWKVRENQHCIIDYFRVVSRVMVNPGNERTLITALFPKGVATINACVSVAFRDVGECTDFAALTMSIPYDFFIKVTQSGNISPSWLNRLVIPNKSEKNGVIKTNLRLRVLLLSCLTIHYSELWYQICELELLNKPERNKNYTKHVQLFRSDKWTKSDFRLDQSKFSNISSDWKWEYALRTDYERRQALIETDVLVAMSLGFKLEQLVDMYRIQFPVMKNYEENTWYDQRGRTVFSARQGVGLPRKAIKNDTSFSLKTAYEEETEIALGWEDIKDLTEGVVYRKIEDDTQPGGPIERIIEYHAPFDKCDRIEDYRVAWNEFERRLAEEGEELK